MGRANLVNWPCGFGAAVFALPRLSARCAIPCSVHPLFSQSTHATRAPANHARQTTPSKPRPCKPNHALASHSLPQLLLAARDRPDLQPLASSTPAPTPTPTPTTTYRRPRLARCAVRIPCDVPAAVQCAAFSAHSLHFCRPSKEAPPGIHPARPFRHPVRSRTATPTPACQLAERVESGRANDGAVAAADRRLRPSSISSSISVSSSRSCCSCSTKNLQPQPRERIRNRRHQTVAVRDSSAVRSPPGLLLAVGWIGVCPLR